MPVMEGKCALFKAYGDVDAYPICLRTKDTEEIIKTVKIMAGSFLSHIVIFFTPSFKRNFAIAMPAAPAPFITSLIPSICLFASFKAFINAAAETIAVPCWSS